MKKKLLIVLLMFISFGLGIFITSSVYSILGEPLLQLCHKKAIDPNEKNVILSEYTKIPNPFFENYYDGLDLLQAKNLYVKNNSDESIDYSCFNKRDIDPWHYQIYLESKKGKFFEVMCSK